ncbi:hypothetical protein [Bosea sp. PAMC 26642]|uniref:hypothetical protein n=1 Tax=Bosea sp. (strain PAMC 26642) TaxID=1792307 RepID=UPI00077030DE|nr:hypothetical protein [Bosea sp. PAMC 26642]AMJ60938.1 hypothetical protein AXW83_12105 [Bosea sp. PAMC 26642]
MSKRPNRLIERVKTALGGDKVTSTKQRLEEQRSLVEQRRSERVQADEAVTAAQAARLANMEADDATLDALDEAIKAAEVTVLRTADRLAVAERRLTEAEELAKAAAADAAHLAVAELIESERGNLMSRYTDVCRSMLDLLQDMAKVDQNLAAIANEGGIEAPPSIESAARIREWAAREELISSKIVTLWTDRNGNIVSPQPSSNQIKRDGAGHYLEAPPDVLNMGRAWNSNHQMEIREKRFRKEVVFERDATSTYIEPWVTKLALPGLGAGHSPILNASPHRLSVDAIEQAVTRLNEQLAELNSRTSPRNQVERMTPVSDAESDEAA